MQRSGTILLLADGTIQACDAIAAQLLGYRIDQLIGQTLDQFTWYPLHCNSDLTTAEHPVTITLGMGQLCASFAEIF